MKQPILSIIVPTRDNIENLEDGFLKSVIINTNNINNIELVFVVDEDDKKTIDFLSNNQALKELTFLQILKRKRSNNITEDYYNYGAKKSYGFFVMPGADDIQIDTPNYDLILIKTREGMIKTEGRYTKHFFLIKTFGEGNVGGDGYCCFPILTRDSVNLLGYFLAPPSVPAWGADWFIDKIYTVLNKVAATHPNIKITQQSQHNLNKAPTERDKEGYRRMKSISMSEPNVQENPAMLLEILKAIHYIVLENLESYTPQLMWMAYESDAAARTRGPWSSQICPDIYLKILWSIQQTLYDNHRNVGNE
tara:strand:+ start:8636 stop:9556 length:921 start_codon:yes stop_codon:yes gene_type:complete